MARISLSYPALRHCNRQARGFTLTELAVVLVIVALLVGGMVMPLSAQQDLKANAETERSLAEIREALIGFVVANGRLPCPDLTADPADANYGNEAASCAADLTGDGYLPWKTLGVPEHDAWGSHWTNKTDPRLGHWRYRIERQYAVATNLKTLILTSGATCNSTFPNDCIDIRDHNNMSLIAGNEHPLAVIYSTSKNLQADGLNATFEANLGAGPRYEAGDPTATPVFDDKVIWISRPILINRLLMAGKLP